MLPVSRIEELPRTSFSLRLTGTTGGAYSRSAEKLPAMLLSIRGAAGSAKLTSRGACSAPTRQTTEKPATTQGAGFQIPTDFDRLRRGFEVRAMKSDACVLPPPGLKQ